MASKAPTKQNFGYDDRFKQISSVHSLVNEVVHFISKSLKKYTNVSLQEITVFQWVILFVCVWILLRTVLFKLTKIFLRRIGVDEINSKLLIKAIWGLCFYSITSYMIAENLNLDIIKFTMNSVKMIHKKANECFLNDKVKVARSEVLFVIVMSYLIHSKFWNVVTNGFKNAEFLQTELISVFIILTRSLRCTQYGMMVLLFIYSHRILEEFTKLMCTLSLICNSNILKNFTKFVYVVHIFYWGIQRLYQFPQVILFMFSRKIDSSIVEAELNLLVLVSVILPVYYIFDIFTSSANRLLCHFVRPRGENPVTIEYLVFGCLEDNVESSSNCLFKYVNRTEGVHPNSLMKNSKIEEKNNKPRVVLYQTVRCYMVLKRKLKRIREKREKELAAKVGNSILKSEVDLNEKISG